MSCRSGEIDQTPGTLATVLLSKPSASWRLTVRSKATGKVVDTREGGAARGELGIRWSGRTPAGTALPSGPYDWTLPVTPADGVGGPLEVRGSVRLLHGSPVRHDHVGPRGLPDGTGDLLTSRAGSATRACSSKGPPRPPCDPCHVPARETPGHEGASAVASRYPIGDTATSGYARVGNITWALSSIGRAVDF
ncbi:hypothetical protein GCM10027074_47010 [Streptomyces deserti]